VCRLREIPPQELSHLVRNARAYRRAFLNSTSPFTRRLSYRDLPATTRLVAGYSRATCDHSRGRVRGLNFEQT
jgi:hypothetical protein